MNAKLTPMLGALLVTAVALAGCSGSSYNNPMSPSPTYPAPASPTPAPVAASLTITFVAMNADKSFSPNLSSIVAGQTVAFYNADSSVHRIVADNGSFDTGNLAPGGYSAPTMMSGAGTFGFHCVIHPTEVGTLNVTGQ
jgi:plastocyanin